MSKLFATVLIALVSAAGCGNVQTVPVCVTGRVESCPCSAGGIGTQECLPDGTFDNCICADVDAATVDAATVDAGSSRGDGGDAALGLDGGFDAELGPLDAGVDAFTPDAGPVHGHAVLIGSEAYVADDSVDRELVNAVFLTERPGDVDIVEYTERSEFTAGWDTRTRVRGIIDGEATARGRHVTYRDLGASTSISTALGTADVLLVYGQERASGFILGMIGTAWHDTLDAYLSAGGVVVILTSRDVHEEWRLVSGTGLFNSLGDASPFGRGNVEVVMPADPVVAGVLSPYPPPAVNGINCFPGMTGGALVARTTNDPPSSQPIPTLCPVIRHISR